MRNKHSNKMADKSRAIVFTFVDVWCCERAKNIWTCSIDGTAVSHTFVGQNETLNGHSSQAKGHKLTEQVVEYKVRCTNPFCRVLVAR